MIGPETLVPVSLFVSIAAAVILRGPLGRALAERMSSRGQAIDDAIRRAPPWVKGTPPPDPETQFLSAELDELRQRLAEVEERQDFTERLLAQQRERPAVGPGR
jgi:hypothetical protein